MALLQYVRVIMSWGGLGNISFREKLIFILASLWKVAENCPKSYKAIMVIAVPSYTLK